MTTLYPGALDDGTSMPVLDGTDTIDSATPNTLAAAIEAVEAKVGIGAATPDTAEFLVGTGSGESDWLNATDTKTALAIAESDVTGLTTDLTGKASTGLASTSGLTGTALSVPGRASNSTGALSEISAGAATGYVLRESASALSFGTVATAGIADDAVTLAKMANMATASLIGRNAAGTGDPEVLSAPTGRSVLGLGTAATQNTGTSGANVPLLNGANTWSATQATVDVSVGLGRLRLNSPLSAAQITTDVNNYAPSGFDGTINQLRITLDADHNITGLLAGTDGDLLLLLNITASSGIATIKNESSSSTVGNRIRTIGGTDTNLHPGGAVLLCYAGVRWRFLSQ